MIFSLIPALLAGALIGRAWASFFRPEGPRRQWGAEIGGCLTALVLTFMLLLLSYAAARDFLPPETFARWRWVFAAMPYAYAPVILAASLLSSRMARSRAIRKYQEKQSRMKRLREQGQRLRMQETPVGPGDSALG